MEEAAKQRLRALPQVQRLLETPAAQALVAVASRPAVVVALRTVLDDARVALHQGRPVPWADELLHQAEAVLHAARRPFAGGAMRPASCCTPIWAGRPWRPRPWRRSWSPPTATARSSST